MYNQIRTDGIAISDSILLDNGCSYDGWKTKI